MKHTLLLSFCILFCVTAYTQDNLSYKGSWCSERQYSAYTPVLKMLKSLQGNFTPVVCRYEDNVLAKTVPFKLDVNGKGFIEADGVKWECTTFIQPVNNRKGTFDIKLTFKLTHGEAQAAGVAAIFDIAAWSESNYVLIPGAAYNGNRFRSIAIDYPPMFYNDEDFLPSIPVTVTDVPRLYIEKGISSKIEFTTGDAATPMVAYFDPASRQSFFVQTEQETRFGNSGMFVEENVSRTNASIVISAPAVREYRPTGPRRAVSDDKGIDWKTGDEITLHLLVTVAKTNDIDQFYSCFMTERKAMSGQNSFRQLTPYSAAWAMQEKYQNSPDRWFAKGGYYKNGNGDTPFGHIQIGWVGGLMQTYPLLMRSEQSRQRVASTFDTVFGNMVGKSGFIHGIYKDGVCYGDNFKDMEKIPQIAMVRKNADVLYFMVKQLMLMKESEQMLPDFEKYETGTRKLADAFVMLWKKYGEFGQLVNVDTGELHVYGSTAAAIAPAGLALASDYFGDPEYMQVAKASAELYYMRDVKKGYTTGAPGEILQCPDSESAFAMLESFVTLYELTGDKHWIAPAELVAGQCASWVTSYDYRFPESSNLGKAQCRSTGAVVANAQNKHAAPGACTTSGASLLRLYRATGNPLYIELLRDMAHNILEFMSTRNHPLFCAEDAYASERVNMSDWEGKWSIGHLGHCGSTSWPEVAIMLTVTEVPGIYVRPAEGIVFVFDHIEATVVNKDKNGITVEIKNTTQYDANVTILSESSPQAKKPLGWNNFVELPQVTIAKGEIKRFRIENNNTISEQI